MAPSPPRGRPAAPDVSASRRDVPTDGPATSPVAGFVACGPLPAAFPGPTFGPEVLLLRFLDPPRTLHAARRDPPGLLVVASLRVSTRWAERRLELTARLRWRGRRGSHRAEAQARRVTRVVPGQADYRNLSLFLPLEDLGPPPAGRPELRLLVEAFIPAAARVHHARCLRVRLPWGPESLAGERDGTCLVCGEELAGGLVGCGACETPHHGECWDFAGGCAVFGCPGATRPGASPGARPGGPS